LSPVTTFEKKVVVFYSIFDDYEIIKNA